jgi:hypothetical protein
MRWVLRLITTGDDARCLSTDLIEVCRPEGLGDIANLGLTLPEAKQLLASVQRAVVSGQADRHGLQRPCCRACSGKCHLKDWRGHRIGTLFGEVIVRLPRFRCTACNRIETSVGWPSRCRSTRELDQLQAHLSALMTYRVAAGVLQHLLPVDTGRSPETLRNHTMRIGERLCQGSCQRGGLSNTTLIGDHAVSMMRSAMMPRVRKRWRRALVGRFRLRRERG